MASVGCERPKLARRVLLAVVGVILTLSVLPANAKPGQPCEAGEEDCECATVIVIRRDRSRLTQYTIVEEQRCYGVPWH